MAHKRHYLDRAGTPIDHSNKEDVRVQGKFVGTICRTSRVYQCGGSKSLATLVFRKAGLFALHPEVWEKIRREVDSIEAVDAGINLCFRISTIDAERLGMPFDGPIGRRFGIPFAAFDPVDKEEHPVDWKLIKWASDGQSMVLKAGD